MANFASLAASPALAPIVVVGLIGTVAASDYRCVRGDQTARWIQVAVEDSVQNVTCEVVYWKDAEQPGARRVLWNAQIDAAYCTRKADELVATLEAGGWSCAPVEGATTHAARETMPAVVESPAAEIADPAAAARLGSAPNEAKEAEPANREPPAIRAALAPQRSKPQLDAGAAGVTEGKPAEAILGTIVEQHLVRLNEGVEGRFFADIGGYGDLDGDGFEDGLVFFTYESERLRPATFVAAYLYDGKRYALAAKTLVAGGDVNVRSADIDSIDDGVISLRLSVLEPGDASCCPSDERQQRLVLRDGQLVEVTSSASPMPGQTEQALAPQPPAVPAMPGAAARLQVASEASSSFDDRPAADIRVFIHHVAHHERDAALARRLADHLRGRGFTVADIRPVDLSISKPSVRYFFARDRAASRRLVEELGRFKEAPSRAPDQASDFTHFIPKPRPGNVEVWLPAS
jgi:hypothetical protein